MIRFVREVVKLTMFIIIWGIPIYLADRYKDSDYLWLFLACVLVMSWVFSHYEDLENVQKNNKEDETTKE